LVPDPSSVFGGLLRGCIADRYDETESRLLAEGVAYMMLGAFSSVVTTYVLSAAGILV
jgi:hypothetical protein